MLHYKNHCSRLEDHSKVDMGVYRNREFVHVCSGQYVCGGLPILIRVLFCANGTGPTLAILHGRHLSEWFLLSAVRFGKKICDTCGGGAEAHEISLIEKPTVQPAFPSSFLP